MTPTFLLFHAENVNENQNAICHLVLIPVIDGIPQSPEEFFFNPEARYFMVLSGITQSQIETFPSYSAQWHKVQAIFDRFDMAVSSADGNSARSLFNTLTRLGIQFNPIKYCNAKSICRRTLNEVSYSFDFLCFKLYSDFIPEDEPVLIAQRWCELALKGLSLSSATSFDELFSQTKITPGLIAPDDFHPSRCKRDYSSRYLSAFDPTSVPVDAEPDNPFYGMNVVFTGKMESMKRDDARAAVIRIGGNAPERLTQETDYLVVGVQDLRIVGEKGLSGKMKTAAKYKDKGMPIEIIDEKDFLDMLNSDNR